MTKKPYINSCLQYFVSSVHRPNDGRQKNQNKRQNKPKGSEKALNNLFVRLSLPTFFVINFKFFDFIHFLVVFFNSSSVRHCFNGSKWKLHENGFISLLSQASCNLSNLFSICIFIKTESVRDTIMQIALLYSPH